MGMSLWWLFAIIPGGLLFILSLIEGCWRISKWQ
jgi:hypothetical protein